VVYVPYVEDVQIPASLYESEPFRIIITLSASYRPAILNGIRSQRDADVGVLEEAYRHKAIDCDLFGNSFQTEIPEDWNIYLETLVRDPLGNGEPVNQFSYEVPGLPTGTVRIAFWSTREEEFGGIGWFYYLSPLPGDPVDWIDKYVEKREIIIEVLPRETGSSS